MDQLSLFHPDEIPNPFEESLSDQDKQILDLVLPRLKQFEGFRSAPYADVVGVWTIGYGSTQYENGTRVSEKDPAITEAQAEELVRYKLAKEFLPQVKALCPNLTKPTQYAALVLFAYNVGLGALTGSTLRKLILSGDLSGAADQFPRWNKAGGKVVPGLTNRRLAEQALFTA